ncbi:MAG: hypothetical protein ACOYL7_18300, partial [Caldilinea sp.]
AHLSRQLRVAGQPAQQAGVGELIRSAESYVYRLELQINYVLCWVLIAVTSDKTQRSVLFELGAVILRLQATIASPAITATTASSPSMQAAWISLQPASRNASIS